MASSTQADEEARDRVMRHMNQAHTRELSHMVRHFSGASASEAVNPSLRDLTLQGMRVRAGGNDYAVPFSPPLADWSEARHRIIAMDAKARQGLGISDVYVTRYVPFRPGLERIVVFYVFFYIVCRLTLPFIQHGSAVWAVIDAIFPGGFSSYTAVVRFITLPMFAVHFLETVVFDRKLRSHGIDRWSGLWWKWSLDCFVEGVCAFRKLNHIVAETRAAKKKS
ncbi:hypothetical protein CDD80_5591 [Ophiocordyceps camponoti-rufipedis]|uniref:DUF2470 domain-containing protein n=1 Tax=Ophiocordyceps camponoti-rufipedis TaxID=2004952 RepID=A0A2C5ZB76_9HYPO|nr:hypothetical protein CDD80_5591 [Ophiocordyceps camponoti-rufipedis]